MANKYGPSDVRVLVHGHDISGNTQVLETEKEAVLEEDTHGFGDAWVEREYVGVRNCIASQEGHYDDEDGQTEDAFVGHEGVDRVVTFLIEGNTQGKKCQCGIAISSSVVRRSGRGQLSKLSAEWAGDGVLSDAVIVQSLAAESGAGATSDGSQDDGGSSSDGGTGYLQVTDLALGGYTSVTAKLQDSPDNSVWTDVAAGDQEGVLSDLRTTEVQRVGYKGMERYVRAVLTLAGTTPIIDASALVIRGNPRKAPVA